MGPAELAIKNRLMSFIVIALALIGGWQAYQTMPRFEDPEFTIREAQVITPYPGATPEEVANEVTEALETAIQQLQEVKEIRSVSSVGPSTVSSFAHSSTVRPVLRFMLDTNFAPISTAGCTLYSTVMNSLSVIEADIFHNHEKLQKLPAQPLQIGLESLLEPGRPGMRRSGTLLLEDSR